MSPVLVLAIIVAPIVLKVMEVIDWPWVWVLAPFWIPTVIYFAFLAFLFLFSTEEPNK